MTISMQALILLRGGGNFEKYANRIETVGNHENKLSITTPTDDKSLIFCGEDSVVFASSSFKLSQIVSIMSKSFLF